MNEAVAEKRPTAKQRADAWLQKHSGLTAAALLALIVIPFIWLLAFGERKEKPDEQAAFAWVHCKTHVRDRLKAPATAEFPAAGYSVRDEGSGRFAVASHVDSQNAFGAMLRSDWTCRLQWLGGQPASPDNWRLLGVELRGR